MRREMKRGMMLLVCALSIFAGIDRGTCQTNVNSRPAKGESPSIVVFAAASLTNALDEIRARFTEETGIAVQTSYGSSSTLARQIEKGAPADVFLSADVKWGDHLSDNGLVAQRRDLLGNRLVLIVPKDSTLTLRRPADLLTAGVDHLALGDPDSVPAGQYAKQAFKKLGLWDQLRAKVAAAEDVRHALAFVETGAAAAGVVYATDAAISKKVRVAFEIPESLTGPVRYPLVLLQSARNSDAAKSFYRYLASRDAASVFRKHGFTILPDASNNKARGSTSEAAQ